MYITLLIIATVPLGVPGTILAVAFGCLFDNFIECVILLSVGLVAGDALAYWIAKLWLKDFLAPILSKNMHFLALKKASKKEPMKILLLIRCLYPPGFLNYFLAYLHCDFWSQFVLSDIIVQPFFLIWMVYIGRQCRTVIAYASDIEIDGLEVPKSSMVEDIGGVIMIVGFAGVFIYVY